jgi:hypothetical protein
MVMRKKYNYILTRIFVLLMLVTGIETAIAQKTTGLQFNEILVSNNSNCVDDYGVHSPWIEIYNQANNFVNIGGCYLTDDLNNPIKYWIPDGDRSTIMEPKGYLVFWADGKPERGIFHLNFELKNAKTIALFDENGSKLLDKLEIAQPQKPDVTYGRSNKAGNEWVFLDKSTPGTNNDLSKRVSRARNDQNTDSSGFINLMRIIGIVLFVFAILFVIYKNSGRFFSKRGTVKTKMKDDGKLKQPIVEGEIPNEINAAIAMVLFLYQNELHDNENAVLTMQRVSKTYSPWSSKIYSLRKLPR